MWLLVSLLILAFLITAANIWRIRRRRIGGVKSRNKYFRRLAGQLNLSATGDEYLVQLEGNWKGRRVIVYPHNFEGPGSITLLHMETSVPFRERTWLEPTLGLGRAIAEWKRGAFFSYERSGNLPGVEELQREMEKHRATFPFIALTVPSRFLLSQSVTEAFRDCANFVVVVALDAGRKPALARLTRALDVMAKLSEILEVPRVTSGH